METQDLINRLAMDAKVAKRPEPHLTLIAVAAGGLAVSAAAILLMRGIRPDFASTSGWVAAKAGISLLFALVAFAGILRLARPGRSLGPWGVTALCMLAIAAIAANIALAGLPFQDWPTALTGGGFPYIVLAVPALAAPAAIGLFMWLRRQAPTQLPLAGAAAGGLAGGLAAMAYALNCPVDSIAFVALWYPLSIGASAALGAIAGSYALRW